MKEVIDHQVHVQDAAGWYVASHCGDSLHAAQTEENWRRQAGQTTKIVTVRTGTQEPQPCSTPR